MPMMKIQLQGTKAAQELETICFSGGVSMNGHKGYSTITVSINRVRSVLMVRLTNAISVFGCHMWFFEQLQHFVSWFITFSF